MRTEEDSLGMPMRNVEEEIAAIRRAGESNSKAFFTNLISKSRGEEEEEEEDDDDVPHFSGASFSKAPVREKATKRGLLRRLRQEFGGSATTGIAIAPSAEDTMSTTTTFLPLPPAVVSLGATTSHYNRAAGIEDSLNKMRLQGKKQERDIMSMLRKASRNSVRGSEENSSISSAAPSDIFSPEWESYSKRKILSGHRMINASMGDEVEITTPDIPSLRIDHSSIPISQQELNETPRFFLPSVENRNLVAGQQPPSLDLSSFICPIRISMPPSAEEEISSSGNALPNRSTSPKL